ncbi:MAG: hypothetical protein AAB423_00480 [Patescibacteria group bacterium]
MKRIESQNIQIPEDTTDNEVASEDQTNGDKPDRQRQSVIDHARLLPQLRTQRPPSQTVDTSPELSRLPRTRFGDRASRENY